MTASVDMIKALLPIPCNTFPTFSIFFTLFPNLFHPRGNKHYSCHRLSVPPDFPCYKCVNLHGSYLYLYFDLFD